MATPSYLYLENYFNKEWIMKFPIESIVKLRSKWSDHISQVYHKIYLLVANNSTPYTSLTKTMTTKLDRENSYTNDKSMNIQKSTY